MKRIVSMAVALAVMLITPALADQLDDYVKLQMEKQRIPGLSLAIVKNGQIVKLQSYGLANIELNIATTPDTVFKIGSLSKPFIATGIMLLVADGKVAVTDKGVKFLSGVPDAGIVLRCSTCCRTPVGSRVRHRGSIRSRTSPTPT